MREPDVEPDVKKLGWLRLFTTRIPEETSHPQELSISSPRPESEINAIDNTHATGVDAIHADYSLRSSGSTYIEREKEAQEIIDRIKTSSASVIGIAGVRGAGKSSLAKKVLNECDDAGFFTLLIPSPTEYDAKDFLLAIFQRIAEHATERVQNIIEGAESLAELGDRHTRSLRRQVNMIFCAIALLCVVLGAGFYWSYKVDEQAKILSQMKDLTDKQALLSDEQQKRRNRPSVATLTPPKDKTLPAPAHEYPSYDNSRLEIDSLPNFKTRLTDLSDAVLLDINRLLETKIEALQKRESPDTKFPIIWGGVGSIASLGVLGAILYIIKLFQKLQISNAHKIMIGLRYKCRAFMELIKYQSVLASGSEFTLAPKFLSSLSGKFSNSKQLEDRPLSLPGLTATCSEFLRDVSEVFSGKVVICIDELDKITDVTELFKLLKGIKGILGQENTHFILTVSEDAMAFFNERLSRERSLVESSFEEIIYLDRLTRDLTNKVISQSLAATESNSEDFLRNCAVQWVFAGGIPREIKRNLFACYSRGISMNGDSSVELWRVLYLGMLNSMLGMSTPKEAAGVEDQYKFLICIETLIDRVKSLPDAPDFHKFMREVLGILGRHFGPAFRTLLAAHPNHPAKGELPTTKTETASSSIYFAQLVEALIGAIILAIANNDIASKENDAEQLDLLIYVYKYVPINPRYAFYGLNRFLETKLKTLEINLNDLFADSHTPKLAAL